MDVWSQSRYLLKRLLEVSPLLRASLMGAVLFGLALYRYYVPYHPERSLGTGPESIAIARNLAYKGSFASPFAARDTGPTTHLAPVFPFLLALQLRTFGDGSHGFQAFAFCAAVCQCVTLALFPLAAHALGLGMIAGGLASLIWIVAGLPTHPNWEATYAALLVLGVTCLLHSYFQRASLSKRQAAFAGVACGMVALALPAALPALTAIGAWLVLRHRLGIPQILLLGLGFLAVLMPWVIRNYRVFDAFIPVRGNFGLELALANNDCATFGARLSEAVGCFQRNHPGRGPEQLEVYARLGEVRYNQERLGTAIAWIRQNPARFLRLLVQRAVAFWFPDERGGGPFGFRWRSPRRVERIAIHTMTLLSPLGLWLLLRSNRIAAQLFALWLSVFPLTYYVLHFEDRYRWPIMWISFMLAALVLVKGLARLYDGAVQAISPGSARQGV